MKPVFRYYCFGLGFTISIGWSCISLAQVVPVTRPVQHDLTGQKNDTRNMKRLAGTWSFGQPFTDRVSTVEVMKQ